ncbi:MAG: hypothetical protein CMC90_01270 [Flavobacteriaceae bacterium]|nr:hypothetical protein [Flavobacteriaceae bacterium]|tara:strand:+ start:114 stop:683 length:570 start_codon:yes stop_codon:yes gene_type:complete
MDRRKAIKNIGLSFGTITLSSSVVSIIKGCQSSDLSWTPKFFNNYQLSNLELIMESIIPETDTPGAISLKIVRFADSYLNATLKKSDKEIVLKDLNKFLSLVKKETNSNNLSSEIFNQYLLKYLDKNVFENENEKFISSFLENIRNLTVRSYKVNEYVMFNILNYRPVPGKYDGCADLSEFGIQGSVPT